MRCRPLSRCATAPPSLAGQGSLFPFECSSPQKSKNSRNLTIPGVGTPEGTRLHFLSLAAKENRGVAAVETGGKQQSPGLLHLNVRVQKIKKERIPEGIRPGTPEGTRLHFRPGMGENRCAAPSSRRRRRSFAPHFDVRVSGNSKTPGILRFRELVRQKGLVCIFFRILRKKIEVLPPSSPAASNSPPDCCI